MGKIKINKYQLYSIIVTIILIITMLLFLLYSGDTYSVSDIRKWSWISFVIFGFILYTNMKIFNSIFNSFNIYIIAFYLFTSGQLLLLILSSNYSDVEIFKYSLFTNETILKATIYTCLGTLALHLGMLIGNKRNKHQIIDTESQQLDSARVNAVKVVSIILCLISIPIDLYIKLNYAIISINSGYGTFYRANFVSYTSMLNTIALFSVPGCFLLATVYRHSKYKIIPLGYLLLSAGLYMIIGTRSYGTTILVALAWFYYVTGTRAKKTKKINIIRFILIILLMYSAFAFLQAVKDVRSLGDKSLFAFLSSFYKELTSGTIINTTLSEFGYTIRPLLELVKRDHYNTIQYKHGFTYVFSLIMIIPSFLRRSLFAYGVEHVYLNIEIWLDNQVRAGFGIGYSLLAEAYFNFGNYGWIVLIPYGVILAKLFNYKKTVIARFSLKPAMVATMLALLIFSVRSQSQLLFKYVVLYYLIPQLLIKLMENRYKKRYI